MAKGLKLYLWSRRFTKLIITFSLYIRRTPVSQALAIFAPKTFLRREIQPNGGENPRRGNIEAAPDFLQLAKCLD